MSTCNDPSQRALAYDFARRPGVAISRFVTICAPVGGVPVVYVFRGLLGTILTILVPCLQLNQEHVTSSTLEGHLRMPLPDSWQMILCIDEIPD